jgi:hypothetical protein
MRAEIHAGLRLQRFTNGILNVDNRKLALKQSEHSVRRN